MLISEIQTIRKFRGAWLGWVLATGLGWWMTSPAAAEAFTQGHLLVTATTSGAVPRLYEYTTDGALVCTLFVSNYDAGEVRDVAVDLDGNAQIFNGTFNPILTTYHANSASSLPTNVRIGAPMAAPSPARLARWGGSSLSPIRSLAAIRYPIAG
ncbi:MAG: hypothetical protein NTW03_01550 [Verrucomicrobia bacterium]|nr:hypothetical protein [Verrucomicrobiota bacterium]